jgi:hypothetical protein
LLCSSDFHPSKEGFGHQVALQIKSHVILAIIDQILLFKSNTAEEFGIRDLGNTFDVIKENTENLLGRGL